MPLAIITGSSRGLGLALARALAERDWALVIDARDPQALERSARELGRITEVVALPGDVADDWHRGALLDAAGDQVDLLVNNASLLGPSPQPPLGRYPLEVLERVYQVNVLAPLALTQLVLPRMPDGGAIVNVSSDAAIEPYAGWGGYGSSKAALDQLTSILSAEHPGLRIYSVDPGRHAHPNAPGGVPGRGHLGPPAARGERARTARADRGVNRMLPLEARASSGLSQRPLRGPRTGSRGDRGPMSALAFELEADLEAHEPPEARGLPRDGVRLLVARRSTGEISHHTFRDLPDLLAPGDVVVLNVSATIPAAVPARRSRDRRPRPSPLRHSRPAPGRRLAGGRDSQRRRPAAGAAARWGSGSSCAAGRRSSWSLPTRPASG